MSVSCNIVALVSGTVRKSSAMQNISPIFCGANDVVEHYGKIILRTDQTGHGHPTLFDRNWLHWPCPVRSALKRTPVQDFDSFSIMIYYIISITY